MSAAAESEWWGARNGRRADGASPGVTRPATEWIATTSSASASPNAGRIVGSRRASIVFPVPGGPTMSTAWPPAAAISSARLAMGWPATSAMSAPSSGSVVRHDGTGAGRSSRRRQSTSSASVGVVLDRMLETRLASGMFGGGSTSVGAAGVRARSLATGSTPRTGRSEPSSPSSPRATMPSVAPCRSWPVATSRPNAMGRSNAVPSFFVSAGARLTVTRRGGTWKPEFVSAAETRSRLSRTAPAGRPTMVHCGNPAATSTSTRT